MVIKAATVQLDPKNQIESDLICQAFLYSCNTNMLYTLEISPRKHNSGLDANLAQWFSRETIFLGHLQASDCSHQLRFTKGKTIGPPPPPTPNLSEQGVIRENTKVKKLRIDKALLDKSWNVF